MVFVVDRPTVQWRSLFLVILLTSTWEISLPFLNRSIYVLWFLTDNSYYTFSKCTHLPSDTHLCSHLLCKLSKPIEGCYRTSLIVSNVVNIKQFYTYIYKSKCFSHTYMSTWRHTHMHTHTHNFKKHFRFWNCGPFSWKMTQ